jgi:hypothetical protein
VDIELQTFLISADIELQPFLTSTLHTAE